MGWKDIVKTVAPALGTALGTPLIGTAVKVLADKILGDENAPEADVQKAIEAGLPPDTLVKLREVDAEFKLKMEAAGLEIRKLEAETEQAYLSDVQDARKTHANDGGTFWMGVSILGIFAATMIMVLIAAFKILSRQILVDPGTAAVVFTLIGTIVGYVAAQAQTVVNFVFGSSRGSAKKTDDLSSAVQQLAKIRGAGQL